ncbi:MAG: mechanosensitive ion channel family protein [Proteobacteria bacterium]|nr:mechanosensitive ion channel family protein [Pseudomonadota bacterium]
MLADAPASPAQQLLDHPVIQSTRLLDRFAHIDWPELSLEWGVRVGSALLVLIGGIWLSKLLARMLARVFTRLGAEGILTTFLCNATRAVCIVIVALIAMDMLGLPTTSLLAVVGAAGLGIGLAMKDSLSNIAAGVMLIALRPFRIGDEVQVAGIGGVIEQVRIFQTVLRTADNRVITLPNGLITAAPITNFTARDRRRVDLTLAIAYEDDIRIARAALIAAAAAHTRVLAEPAPDVLVADLAESSIQLLLRAWVATPDYAIARSELLEAARTALRGGGMSVPYPRVVPHGLAIASPASGPARDKGD